MHKVGSNKSFIRLFKLSGSSVYELPFFITLFLIPDSEYSSHWKKADVAKANFEQLVDDTVNAFEEKST